MTKKLLLFVLLLPLIVFGQVTVEKTVILGRPIITYKPSGFDPSKKYPVWIFFHGLSEMSRDKAEPERVINNGNHSGLLAAAEKYKFIVVAPQLIQSLNDWIPGWTNKYLQPVYDYVVNSPTTDITHIVVTGLSLGGGGTWVSITGNFAPYVSAAIPICGTPQYDQDYSQIAKYNIPVLAFHAKDDKTVGFEATINTVSAINKYNPVPAATATILNSGGHGIWGGIYSGTSTTGDIYTWALTKINAPDGVVVTPTPTVPIDEILSTFKIIIYKSGVIKVEKQ